MNLDFGIKEGKVIKITDVKSGLACDCYCPACGAKLIAKKGKVKQHHFAHYRIKECKGYLETTLHLASKEILKNNSQIALPFYNIEKGVYENNRVFNYRTCILEKSVKDIIPDAQLIFSDKHKIFVEIKVTHGIEEEKLSKLKDLNISTLEIDLEKVYIPKKELTYEELKEIVLYNFNYRKWVYDKNFLANQKRYLKLVGDRRIAKLKKEKEEEKKRRVKELEKNKRITKYLKSLEKTGCIGVLWLYDDESTISGTIKYGVAYSKVRFTRYHGNKKKAPIYFLDNEGMKVRTGALWRNSKKFATGYIDLNQKKLEIDLIRSVYKKHSKSPDILVFKKGSMK